MWKSLFLQDVSRRYSGPIRAHGCKTELIFSINLLYVTFHPLLKTRNLSIILNCSLSFTLEFLAMDQFIAFFFISSITYLIQSIILFSFTSTGVSVSLVRSPFNLFSTPQTRIFLKCKSYAYATSVFKSVRWFFITWKVQIY